MTKREALRQTDQENTLRALGFSRDEAEALRRISMTLHRWHELECGDSNSYGSWAIERDDNGDGPPFMVHHHYRHGQGKDGVTRTRIPDREAGARKRLDRIISERNKRAVTAGSSQTALGYYIQGDPRGVALYILVPDGADVHSYYTRGVCVY